MTTYSPGSLSYRDDLAGRTLDEDWQPISGFRCTELDVVLGMGMGLFMRAVEATTTWGIQRRAGIRVRDVHGFPPVPRTGDVVHMQLPLWPKTVSVRIVGVVDEPDRIGFAYGTMPGHPTRGEEGFLVECLIDDSVVLRMRSFAHPRTGFARVTERVGVMVQRMYIRRYVRSLARTLS